MVLDFIFIVLCIIVALRFPSLLLEDGEQAYKPILQKLACFHFLLGVGFYFFSRNGGGDAWMYWLSSKQMDWTQFTYNLMEGEGTAFMKAFNFVPANLLGMSYFANTMFYSMIGFFGLTYFFLIAARSIPYNKIIYGYVLFPLILFLPNLHFWSSGIGKDTVLFMCIGMIAYALMKPNTRFPLLIVAVFLALAIRPHIILFLIMSFGLAYIFGGQVSLFQRIIFSVILVAAGIAILPNVLEFAKLEDASTASFDKFAESKAAILSRAHTGSAVDISSYPLPLKIFTFLFRPFFFDIKNFQGFVASLENLILVVIFIKAMGTRPGRAFRAAPFVIKGLFFFLIIGTLAFAQTLGNLGIMIRMRNMLLPGMLIFLMWCFSYQQQRLLNQKVISN